MNHTLEEVDALQLLMRLGDVSARDVLQLDVVRPNAPLRINPAAFFR